MTYAIDLAKLAKQDAIDAVEWYSKNYSNDFAQRWYEGLQIAIRSLAENPGRCGFAHENHRLSNNVRQLLYGKSKRARHRILFTVEGQTVFVVRIRHSAQKDLRQSDLLD